MTAINFLGSGPVRRLPDWHVPGGKLSIGVAGFFVYHIEAGTRLLEACGVLNAAAKAAGARSNAWCWVDSVFA